MRQVSRKVQSNIIVSVTSAAELFVINSLLVYFVL